MAQQNLTIDINTAPIKEVIDSSIGKLMSDYEQLQKSNQDLQTRLEQTQEVVLHILTILTYIMKRWER